MTTACAPGKVILFGEHAVVYGRPAIAVPVTKVRACATVEDLSRGRGVRICACDLQCSLRLGETIEADHAAFPLATTVEHTLAWMGMEPAPDIALSVSSTVPIARGLGSGAAVATAVVRALTRHQGRSPTRHQVSELVYQTEILHHGTPSGIDNSVIAFEQPVFFVKGQPIEALEVGQPFWLVIGDTGIASPTRVVVGDVRRAWEMEPALYESLFDRIGSLAQRARQALAYGRMDELGELMDANQILLKAIKVSSPALDKLVVAARVSGALGAKLCGAGRGGNMIALVPAESARTVEDALKAAGATNTIVTEVQAGVAHANRH